MGNWPRDSVEKAACGTGPEKRKEKRKQPVVLAQRQRKQHVELAQRQAKKQPVELAQRKQPVELAQRQRRESSP